ncbi:MAG TPA: hypothetical protein VKV26_23080 [Dehalococcoidia bacterium]|nr:hypothetical protein [Dehalococcoidia bacterium]
MAAGASGVPLGGAPWRMRAILAAAVLALLVMVALLALLALRGGGSNAAAKLPPLPALQYRADLLKGDVQEVAGNTVTLAPAPGAKPRQLTLGPQTRIEALLPAAPGAIAVGDGLTIGGVPNLVNSFAIKLVVLIPAAQLGQPGALPPKSAGGFTGWEAYPSAQQAPEAYGLVTAVSAKSVQLAGRTGSVSVALDEQSPLRRLTSVAPQQIHGGDHLAVALDNSGNPAAVLVLPGDATVATPVPQRRPTASPTPAAAQ